MDAPPFDPSKPFTVEGAPAPAAAGPPPFDPNKPFTVEGAPPEARPGMTGYAASRARNPNTQVDTPGATWGDVKAGISQLAQGVNKPVYGTLGAIADILPYYASKATGGPGARPVSDFLEKYAYPTPPEALQGHPTLQTARAAGEMVGQNIGPQAIAGTLANAGVRSGVTMAQQAAPGIVNKIRGAGDAALEWIAQNPGKAFTSETAGAAESGAGGQIGHNIAEQEGASPEAQTVAEHVGQIVTPGGVFAARKVSPTQVAAKYAPTIARKAAGMVPESMLPEGMQTSGTPQSRAADRNAYANREGPYANPDAPPPPEPNWAVRQMDEGYKQRTENASATVRDQIDQINQRPGAAENRSIAEQLKQNVPGFQPGIAKETGDQALLNLQGRLEGQATGNTLRDLQGNYDKSAQAIRDKFNSVTPAEPAPSPTPPQDVVANAAQQRVADAQSRVGIQQDATQNQLKIAADSLPDAERAASGAKLRDIHATAEQASSDKTTALRKAIANPETPIQVGDQTMTVNEALDRRAAINQETRKYQSTVGTVEGANKMDELAKERAALDKAIEGVNLPGMTEYRTYYRDTHVPQFEEGAGRDINRYDRFGYDKNKVPDEKVLAQFGGPNNISAAKQFTTVHGNNPEAVQLMADHQLGRLKSEAIDPATGALKQGSVDKFLSKNRELLDALPPQVREAVSAKNPDALYERLGQLEQRQKAIGDSKVAGILGQNPEKQLDAALNDWQVMRGVKRSVAKDPVADAALTRAIMARAPDPMDAAKFGSWLDGHDRVLRQVLTPDHLKALKDVAQAAEIQARLPRPTGAAEMPKSGLDKAGEQIGTPIKSLLQRNLAVAQGRVGAPYTAFDVATRAWNTYVSRETDAIWREALFNPDVAKTVAGAVKNQGFVKNKVNWLVNHFKTNGSPNAYLLTTGISDAQNDK